MRTGTRARQCFFLDFLWPLLSFHYSKMDYSYYLLSREKHGASFASRDTGKRMVVVVVGESPLSGALFREHLGIAVFLLGSGMTRSIGFSCGFLDLVNGEIPLGGVGGLYRKGNAQDVERCSEGRTRLVRSCGAKPARRNAIYDTFISKSVFYPLVSSDALLPCHGRQRGVGTEQHLARGRMSLCLDSRRLPNALDESRYRAGAVGREDIALQDKAMTVSRGVVAFDAYRPGSQPATYRSCSLLRSAPNKRLC
ncbi:hypothetical protein CGRA01v4_00530 [Colletotrichum graminicola]|nr:hypothetical protein CGRA01v4_00530 [Colletotrichum graminicola]